MDLFSKECENVMDQSEKCNLHREFSDRFHVNFSASEELDLKV